MTNFKFFLKSALKQTTYGVMNIYQALYERMCKRNYKINIFRLVTTRVHNIDKYIHNSSLQLNSQGNYLLTPLTSCVSTV